MLNSIARFVRIVSKLNAVAARMAVIAAILSTLHACRAQESILIASPIAQAADQQIRANLRQRLTLNYREQPLAETAYELGEYLGINIRFDTHVLGDAGIDASSTPITIHLEGVSAEAALTGMLTPHGLDWAIVDETILITTKEQSESLAYPRIYLVRDLVALNENPDMDDADPLIELITGTLHTSTWSELGGPGTIDYFANAGALVVTQTRAVHDELDQLLSTLRKARGLQRIRPAVESAATVSAVEVHEVAPAARRYSIKQSWNRPQLHR